MPKPVRKEPERIFRDPFLEEMRRDHPEVWAEFAETYLSEPGRRIDDIIGGECKGCGAHVIEDHTLHQEWHMKINFAIFAIAGFIMNHIDRHAEARPA